MHNYNKIIISCTALMLALCNCSSGDEYSRNATGKITLAVEADKTITQSVVSRATTPNMPVLSSLTADKLTLSLTSQSGEYYDTWPSRNEFPAEEEFPADTYTMTASYGNTAAEGFESPQLYGEATFPVVAGKVTPVKLTAKVANSLVMFEPTENFLNYFHSARFVLNSAAGNSLVVNPGETRPVYINPGNASIDARVIMPSGTDALITIGSFTARKATLHRITLDVEASTGTATLTISFDETITDIKPIIIDLTEELFTAPAPVVTPEGFEGNRAIQLIETHTDDYAFNIATRAGLASAKITITDNNDTPQIYDLLNADDHAALEKIGLRTLNLKPGLEFSKIYMRDLISSMRCADRENPSNKEISLSVTDRLGRTTDETLADNNTFRINLSPVTLSVEAIKDVVVHPTYQVKVRYNGSDIENLLKFNTLSNNGTKISANPVKIEPGTAENEYLFTFNTPRLTPYFIMRGEIDDIIYHKDEIFVPQFTPSIPDRDKWAKHATLTIQPDSTAKYGELIAQNIKLSGLSESKINTTADPLKYELTGLTPGQQHTIQSSLNGLNLQSSTFTTEKEIQLPNGGFETAAWSAAKEGDYQYLWSIDGWSTANDITMSQAGQGNSKTAYRATSGTIPANSRSTVSNKYGGLFGTDRDSDGHTAGNPSLHKDKSCNGDNAALIRTVGYGSGNTAGAGTGNPASGFATCQHVASGELFLGEKVNGEYKGIAWGSRPSSIEFNYKYSPYGNSGDYGYFEAVVTDENDVPVSNKITIQFNKQDEYVKISEKFTYPVPYVKGKKILIRFMSSGNPSLTNNSTWLYGPGNKNLSGGEYLGSELYIDDIKLVYDY